MARRYKCGQHSAYDKEFDKAKTVSPILNRNQASISTAYDLQSKSGLERLLLERIGDDAGRVVDPQSPTLINARRLNAKLELAAVEEHWQAIRVRAQRAGRYPPETMPDELVERRLQAEAKLDVTNDEIQWLKKEIAKHEAVEQEVDSSQILKYGPRGSCRGSDPPREVDGQPVVWDEDVGSFLIDCKKSPYHGLKLQNYYAFVVKPWGEAKQEAYQKAYAKAHDLDQLEGNRARAAMEADRILKDPQFPPWPPRPEEV